MGSGGKGVVLNDFLLQIFGRCCSELRDCSQDVLSSSDIDSVHDLRVSIRTYRSLLRAFRDYLNQDMVGVLNVELEWLDSLAQPVRDLDIFQKRFTQWLFEQEDVPDWTAVDALEGSIFADRVKSQSNLLSGLTSQRFLTALDSLEKTEKVIKGHEVAKLVTEEVLLKLNKEIWNDIKHDAESLGEEPKIREFHKLRILTKRARYLAEASEPFVGEKVRRRVKLYESIQDVIGKYHDSTVFSVWLKGLAIEERNLASIIDDVLDYERNERRRLRKKWKKLWEKGSK